MHLFICSLFIFVIYIAFVVYRFGVPVSISETYYLLRDYRAKVFDYDFPIDLSWLFIVFCFGVSLCIMPYWFDITPSNLQFLCFLSGAGLAFVGAASKFKEELAKKVHYSGAVICMVCSQAWVLSVTDLYVIPLTCFSAATVLSLYNKKNYLFWVEIAAFISLYLTIFIEKGLS